MRYCTLCGKQLSGDGVCQSCATSSGQNCPACNQHVPAGNRFCGHCGTQISADQLAAVAAPAPSQPQGAAGFAASARRDVTVLFLDVTNFTAASHGLDSEDVYVWIDETLRLLATVVHKYEGTIDKFTGDGLMALFGAPTAHENDPELAIRAALEMQTLIGPLRERIMHKHGFDFQMRIGINTGTVIAGNLGNRSHTEYTVLGDTVNLASRLEKAAEPGTVLISMATYQRTQPLFDFDILPPLYVKGVDEPLRSFRPLRLRTRPGSLRGLAGLHAPMIGRAHALASLHSALEDVRERQRRHVALITGEAGLGKSRLVAEFRRTRLQPELRFYQGACLAYARSTPLWVIAALMRDMLGLSEVDPLDIQRETLRAHLAARGIADQDILLYAGNVLGLDQADPELAARLRRMDASMLQRQTHTALRQLFLAEAALAPTILVFDDLHWVDPASRDFLEYLIQTVGDAPLLLVLVSRESERQTVVRPLIAAAEQSPDRLTDIQLQALSDAEGELLVDQLICHDTGDAHALKQQIARRAAGNPLYIEEIIRILIDNGGLANDAGSWRVTPQASALLTEVPQTLQGLILTRFDQLPDPLRRSLQKAAVLGRSFPASLLQVLEGISAPVISAQFAELEARQFLVAEPFGWAQGYAFRHVLIQEAVYGTLLKRDRQKLHEQIAQLIEHASFWPKDEQIEVLAYHYAESATPRKAVPYLIDAAENAARRYANETAIRHYRRAMALMPQASAAGDEDFFRVRAGMGQALKYIGQFGEAGQILTEAFEPLQAQQATNRGYLQLFITVVRELADVRQRERAYDAAVAHLEAAIASLGPAADREEPVLWRSIMDRLAWVRFRQGRLEEGLALAEQAIRGVRLAYAEDPIVLASLLNTIGGVHWQRGDFAAAITYVNQSLQLYKDLSYAWGMAISHTNLGILHYVRGQWPKAVESFEQAYMLRREHGYLPEQALNLHNLGTLRMEMGNHGQARQDLLDSLEISQRLGDTFSTICAQIGLSKLAAIQADFSAAKQYAEAAEQLLDSAGTDEAIQLRWLLALIHERNGNPARGRSYAEQALDMARAAMSAEQECECLRVLGALCGRSGDLAAAEAFVQQSVTICQQRHDSYREGLALLELGRLHEQKCRLGQGLGRQAQALESYGRAAQLFSQLGAAYDLDAALAAQQRLAHRSTTKKEVITSYHWVQARAYLPEQAILIS